MDYFLAPIPSNGEQSGWEQIQIVESNQKLVSVTQLDENKVIAHPQYFALGLPGAINQCYIREEVATRLLDAANALPKGYKFLVWDGFRPFEVQKALFEKYYSKLEYDNPGLNHDKLFEMTKQFVSYPSINKKSPAPHVTGGAIDLTIINQEGKPLVMGTAFDDFTSKSATRYYEEKLENEGRLDPIELEALNNRRLLFFTLSGEGFTNFPNEWWHFDFGNQWWAKNTNHSHAIYGIASL